MNLRKKKQLAKKTLSIGSSRIVFVKTRLDEIKEAITKQDIRDLVGRGAIIVKEVKGRKSVKKRKKRKTGKVRMKVNKRKEKYVILTRKLRKYVLELKKKGEIAKDEFTKIRIRIRDSSFKNLAQLKDSINRK
ncbi:MAG: 50S ribosomal protein L19e [Nanoarchaeota archaeon]